jgi:hypothetical protein
MRLQVLDILKDMINFTNSTFIFLEKTKQKIGAGLMFCGSFIVFFLKVQNSLRSDIALS